MRRTGGTVLLCGPLLAHAGTLAGERYALVIAINGYRALDKLTACLADAEAVALFASDDDAKVMDLWGGLAGGARVPVAVAVGEGRGRVVVIGSDTWLRPDELALGDNRRFLLNIAEWLARAGE